MTRAPLVLALLLAACSNPAQAPSGDGSAGGDRSGDSPRPGEGTLGDRGPVDQGQGKSDGKPDGHAADASTPGLPFSYTRPGVGTPVPAAELTTITDKYIDLLKKTRYFDFVDERVHGWPESDPQSRYWYGTWWSGCGLDKSGGSVTYKHVNVGADNIGISTSPVLEGMCFAHMQWGTQKLEHLTRRLTRGLNSWIMAMERQVGDPAGTLLARVSYPEPITSTDGGRTYYIDYSADRPGLDSYCQYVHIPANPYWGDIYIKNNRSKDDIGHMFRAIATLHDCIGGMAAATKTDQAAMEASYVKWAKRVEADGWAIATYNTSGVVTLPSLTSTMSRFITLGNAECDAVLTLSLLGQGSPGTWSCGNGIHPLEWVAMTNDHNGEIVRAFHEAAVKHALLTKQNAIAQTMLTGLATRIEDGVTLAEQNKLPVYLNAESLAAMMIHSANTGVPLTWREVRWLHKQIEAAHTNYVTDTASSVYHVFDAGTPDGSYDFAPSDKGIAFTALATLIGTCVATYRNPTSKPVLDCSRLSTFTP